MKTTELGPNKTGMRAAPGDADALIQTSAERGPRVHMDPSEANALRASYFREAGTLGSVPPPATLGGVVQSGATLLMRGGRMQVLMDKLGERLAFERSGTRLYESFLRKCRFLPDQLGPIDVDVVERFMREEREHFALLSDVIGQLGGDPTAQTPCADAAGVQAMGLFQAVADPCVTVLQSLQALLTAELVDEASWELLITLTRDAGQDDIADRFAAALSEENEHLRTVRGWVEAANLAEARLGAGEDAQARA
jgi:rubrerythrin